MIRWPRLLCTLLLSACTNTPQTDAATIGEGWMRNAAGEPLNILRISIDTMRHDHTRWTGRWTDSFTPHLDEFASEATRFAAASTTATATRPAVASLLTGMYPKAHGVEANRHTLSQSQETLAQILTQSGYSSAAFIGNGLLSEKGGFHQGFEKAKTTSAYMGSLDEEIAENGIQWLRDREQGRPFFLWLHFMDPHGPYFSAPPRIRQEVPRHDGLGDRKLSAQRASRLSREDRRFGNLAERLRRLGYLD
jgi:membrane-anchored protein YejM (alkaline phosphatase superfamily)